MENPFFSSAEHGTRVLKLTSTKWKDQSQMEKTDPKWKILRRQGIKRVL